MRQSPPHAQADLTLAAYLASFAAGRRVLWVGEGGDAVAAPLAGQAARVEVRADGAPGAGPGAFDLAVVPDVGILGEPRADAVRRLADVVGPDGALVLGWPGDDVDAAREEAERIVGDRFGGVRMLGQAPFEGYALARIGASPADVLVDGSLVDAEAAAPVRVLALCVGEDSELDAYAVIRHPSQAGSGTTQGEPGGENPDASDEHARLEAALAERARELRELRQEVDRRGILVRDLVARVERGVAPPAGGPAPGAPEAEPVVTDASTTDGAVLERALEAEAALAEAQFRLDELSARLAEAEGEAGALREANLEGTARGLKSRVAELEEVHALAEGQLQLARMDLEAAADRERRLEQQLGELKEQFELELVRSRGAGSSDRTRAGELETRIEALEGERAGLRARLAERETALEALARAAAAPPSAPVADPDELEKLRAELTEALETRDELVTRLQMDLAAEEKRSREREGQVDRLREENGRLRDAMVEATSAVDASESLGARVEALEQAIARDRDAMREARALLSGLPAAGAGAEARHEITAAGDLPAPPGGASGGGGAEDDLRRQLKALQARATRLQEELEHERQARRAEAQRVSTSPGGAAPELRELEDRVAEREAEVQQLRATMSTRERETKVVRDACSEARQGLEELLGAATEAGDPATAERIGELLRLLGRV